jgi:hypothetical protein
MARIESSSTLIGKKVTRLDGTVSKITGLLTGGYKMETGTKLSTRNLVRQGGKFIEIVKTDIRQLVPHEGYVSLVAGASNSAPVQQIPAAVEPAAAPESTTPQAKPLVVSDRQSRLLARRAKVLLAALGANAEGVAYSNFKSLSVVAGPVTAEGVVSLTVTIDYTKAVKDASVKPGTSNEANAPAELTVQSRTRKWLHRKVPALVPTQAFNYSALVGKEYFALGGFATEQELAHVKSLANKIARKNKEPVTGLYMTPGRPSAGTEPTTRTPAAAPVQQTPAAPAAGNGALHYNTAACKGASEVVAKMKAYNAPSRRVLARAVGLALTDIKAGLVFVSLSDEEFVLDYSSAKDAVILRSVVKSGRIISLDDGLAKFKKLGFKAKGVDDSELDAKH